MAEEKTPFTLPHSIEAEKSILGSILISQDAMEQAAEKLNPEDFYVPANQDIFAAMKELHSTAKAVDSVTVIDMLEKQGKLNAVGGAVYIAELAVYTPSAANSVYYAGIVQERSVQRKLIKAGGEIAKDASQGEKELEELLDDAERKIFNISMQKTENTMRIISEDLMTHYNKLGEIVNLKGKLTGVDTGYPDINRLTSGLQKSDLVIVAGRPAMGKTAFGLNIAANAANKGFTVCIFSLEMSRSQLITRLLCSEAEVSLQNIKAGILDDGGRNKLMEGCAELIEAKIYIDDTSGMSVADIRSRSRRLKSSKGVDLIVIDYLQLMQPNKSDGRSGRRADSRVQEVGEITRSLKILARELDVPVILLSQLSRGPETRGDHRPIMADLRESGSIEQDADMVIMLYRPSVYGDSEGNEAEAIFVKNRNGPTETVHLRWVAEYTKFKSEAKNR